jgi:hypothetical protein
MTLALETKRRSNKPEVVGSNPTPATKKLSRQDDFESCPAFFASTRCLSLKYLFRQVYRGTKDCCSVKIKG